MPYWVLADAADAVPNGNVSTPDTVGPGSTYSPGAENAVEIVDDSAQPLHLRAAFVPSPWDGWPASWNSPQWSQLGPQFDELVDTAYACLDLNSTVLSAMPPYRTRNSQVMEPKNWMINPDPDIYSGWPEFMKQVAWDWQTGEAFILAMSYGSDNRPYTIRAIPPWLVNAEMDRGRRSYKIGDLDVTGDMLHIRYKSSVDSARGSGPLDVGRTRLLAAGVLARYASELARGGGIPKYVLETEQDLDSEDADRLKEEWWQSRMNDLGTPWKPGVLTNGVKANVLQLDPEKMALKDLAQYTDSRIAVLLGVHPFLLGLPSGDSVTYSNANVLFDFHDRRFLKPAATHIMSALSNWALVRGQSIELNRDEYSRPALKERTEAYERLVAMQVLSPEEIRVMERFVDAGTAPAPGESDEDLLAAEVLTGGGRS